MYPRADETGKKYNNLTFLNPIRPGRAGEGAIWLVRCDCGTLVETSRKAIVRGRRKTCGSRMCPHRVRRSRKARPNVRTRDNKERKQRDMYSRYLYTAARKNLSWGISPELFRELIVQECTYCGAPPDKFNQLDRMHLGSPWTESNSVPCCRVCLRMKSQMSLPEFFRHLDKIQLFLRKAAREAQSS